MTKGKYIVLEGPGGTGKTTQLQVLERRLQELGLPVRAFREPDSQSDLTARAIRRITQDPHYPVNTTTEVLLYNAARSQSLQVIKQCRENGIICLVDRNYLTTLAIQYYGRGDLTDYPTITRIIDFAIQGMEPDLCIILDAPVSAIKERMRERYNGERFDNLDIELLERIRAGYLWEAKQRNLPVVFATESKEVVSDQIWQLVAETLQADDTTEPLATATVSAAIPDIRPVTTADAPAAPQLPAAEPYLQKDGTRFTITSTGQRYLDDVLSSSQSNVYAFNDKLSPVTIAAAMARLSRRGDDMRITLLDEFADKADKDAQLLRRVITAYGDDSVQQLVGLHVVVEKASNLLTKKLEWGRLAAYLEQSTRYIYFDARDVSGRFKYHIPSTLDETIRQQYIEVMDRIFELYSDIVHRLTTNIQQASRTPEAERDGAWRSATKAQACDIARALLPVATEATVGIYASGQALEGLIMHLLSDEFAEAREVGQQLLDEARKVAPTFLERADKPDRGGAMIAYRAETRTAVKNLAEAYLSANHADASAPVALTDYWPRNEISLVADMLYEYSDQPLEAIRNEVANWPYDKKLQVFRAYMGQRLNRRQRPGRAIEKAHYSWDLVCDYGIFRDLQRHRIVDDLEWQALTPRHGYEVPKVIEDIGASDEFEQCFDLSLKLYSYLQAAGYTLEAQYATLLGHRMRWKVTYNAREAFHLHELRTSPQGHPGYRKLVQQMHRQLAEVHPLLAEHMQFVNQGEDPELARLAAERYTQFKLTQLEEAERAKQATLDLDTTADSAYNTAQVAKDSSGPKA